MMEPHLLILGLALSLIGCGWSPSGNRVPQERYCAEWEGGTSLDWGQPPAGRTVCIDDECRTYSPPPICLTWQVREPQIDYRSPDASDEVDRALRRSIEDTGAYAIDQVIREAVEHDP